MVFLYKNDDKSTQYTLDRGMSGITELPLIKGVYLQSKYGNTLYDRYYSLDELFNLPIGDIAYSYEPTAPVSCERAFAERVTIVGNTSVQLTVKLSHAVVNSRGHGFFRCVVRFDRNGYGKVLRYIEDYSSYEGGASYDSLYKE